MSIVIGFGKAGAGRQTILTGNIDKDYRIRHPLTRTIFETKNFIIYRDCKPKVVFSKSENAQVLRDVPYGLPKFYKKRF